MKRSFLTTCALSAVAALCNNFPGKSGIFTYVLACEGAVLKSSCSTAGYVVEYCIIYSSVIINYIVPG